MDADPLDPFASYQPELPEEVDERGSQCECCPHALAYEKLIPVAISQADKLRAIVKSATLSIEKLVEGRDQDQQLLETMSIEKYDIQGELHIVREELERVKRLREADSAFLSVLGWQRNDVEAATTEPHEDG